MHPHDAMTRLTAAVIVLLQFQAFVAIMLLNGYSLQVTLGAAAGVTAFSAEILARILGGRDGGGAGPSGPRLPGQLLPWRSRGLPAGRA